MSIPKSVLQRKLETARSELVDASKAYSVADEWPDFEQWHKELFDLMTYEFSGQWPETQFDALRFRAPSSGVGNFYLEDVDEAEHAEAARLFQRATRGAIELLGDMLERIDSLPFKRPYGMEAPTPPRTGPPERIVAGRDVIILNAGTISGSQIQQGGQGNRQTLNAAEVGAVLDRVLALVREVRTTASANPVLQGQVEPLASAIETATQAKTPPVVTIKSLLRGLGDVLAAGNHLTAIAARIPGMLAEIDRFLPPAGPGV